MVIWLTLSLGGMLPDVDQPLPHFIEPQADGSFRAIVRDAHLDERERATLRSLGLTLPRYGDQPVHVGDVWVVAGRLEALHRARDAGFDVEISRRLDLFPPPTTDTGEQVQAFHLWAAEATPAEGYTGEGVTILDIDSGVDVFHPHFFRADAGVYEWVDVDGNGTLDLGVDGVDLDGDGSIQPGEVLQIQQAWAWQFDWDAYTFDYIYQTGDLDPARDWVYLDVNQDGQRNRSSAEGFSEDDPAYGEPIFVPDDADRSGGIDAGERLIRLGSSVVRAVRTPGRVYRRGVNLVDYVETQDVTSHGSGVGGILGGGQLPHQRQTIGLAPDADLLFSTSTQDDAELAETLMWGVDKGADVVLHEYAPWVGFALDGSSSVESMVDAQQAEGVVHVCPAGNLADAGKHAAPVVTDGGLHVGFDVPAGDYQGFPWQYLWLELHGEAGSAGIESCVVTDPSGQTYTTSAGGLYVWSEHTRSGADRPWTTLAVQSTVALEAGDWFVDCDVPSADGTEWHFFLNDYYSGWGRGIEVHDEVPSSTMGVPSTADTCISIGAIAGRHADADTDVGDLRLWSSRGPTVDGRRGIDLVAPDDPFSPSPSYAIAGWEAPYAPFGGTSGASPHVAALAALIHQAQPDWTGLDVRDALMDGASAMDGAPNDVGAGIAQGYTGWSGDLAPTRPDPVRGVSVEVAFDGDSDDCHAVLVLPDGLMAQVDVDYDGSVDVAYSDRPVIDELVGAGEVPLRVELAQGGWVVGGLATSVQVDDFDCPPAGAEPDTEPDETDTDTESEPLAGSGGGDTEGKAGCGCDASPGGSWWWPRRR